MKGVLSRLVLFSFFVLIFSSCGEEIKSVNEFNTFISDVENGYKQSKSVNGVVITVIYTPPEYIAMKEMESSGLAGQKAYDSLLQQSSESASFLMIFGPDEEKGNKGDIMYKDLENFKEYVERAIDLNFDIERKVELRTENSSFAPVLSSLENTYGLSQDRKINFVFTPATKKGELQNENEYDFVYSDETFDVGVLHFQFNKSDLKKELPEINFQH